MAKKPEIIAQEQACCFCIQRRGVVNSIRSFYILGNCYCGVWILESGCLDIGGSMPQSVNDFYWKGTYLINIIFQFKQLAHECGLSLIAWSFLLVIWLIVFWQL